MVVNPVERTAAYYALIAHCRHRRTRTGAGAAIEEPAMLLEAETVTVKTRFGDQEVDRRNVSTFPLGLIGFGDWRSYALIDLPRQRGPSLKFLQCLDQPKLGFTVMPVTAAEGGFDLRDLTEAAEHHEI